MGKSLAFSPVEGEYLSEEIVTDNGSVTINVQMRDDDARHVIVAEHSINGEYWQFCGSRDFFDGIELTIEGLRENVQKVRFRIDAEPSNAEWA